MYKAFEFQHTTNTTLSSSSHVSNPAKRLGRLGIPVPRFATFALESALGSSLYSCLRVSARALRVFGENPLIADAYVP